MELSAGPSSSSSSYPIFLTLGLDERIKSFIFVYFHKEWETFSLLGKVRSRFSEA